MHPYLSTELLAARNEQMLREAAVARLARQGKRSRRRAQRGLTYTRLAGAAQRAWRPGHADAPAA
jgi:hypothetical protein